MLLLHRRRYARAARRSHELPEKGNAMAKTALLLAGATARQNRAKVEQLVIFVGLVAAYVHRRYVEINSSHLRRPKTISHPLAHTLDALDDEPRYERSSITW